jgi:uncharacterized hydrophobic protein (TIGR00271 family)
MTETRTPTASKRAIGLARWWETHVAEGVEHRAVVDAVCEEARWSGHFAFMSLMSAGIAVLGLLLSSPAVVIGAMLISPLMGPIIGLGFALAMFDSVEMRRSLKTLGAGIAIAAAFCALIVLLSPLQTVTDEIASRTRPNLFDLLVALFSGLAGSYAMIRGRHGTIVGVAIATALMPPIAVMGFGIATMNAPVLLGSTLLFFTNLMTITASAAVLARLYGFAPDLSPSQTRLQATLVITVLIALAIPLGLSLRQIAWESVASRQARDTIGAYFGAGSRLGDVAIDFDAQPMEIAATVLTPRYRGDAERDVTERLARLMKRPVQLVLDQVRTGSGNADVAQLAAAKGSPAERGASRVAERLALMAGTSPADVLVDSVHRRAQVRAAPLAGADMASYRALEARVAAADSRWRIALIPPPIALPAVEFEGDGPSEEGNAALETAIWAARRLRLPIAVSAGSAAQRATVVERLTGAGIEARVDAADEGGTVRLQWAIPGS